MPYKNLDQLNCFSKLKEAASLNYTEPEEALFKNIQKKHITSPYLSFNYSYSQCNETLLTQFETWLEESHLYEQFQNMIDQKIINYSENRAVSHHQYRIQQSNESRDIDTLKKYCKTLRDTWKTENTLHKKAIVHIGIGGSESGPKACYHALKHLYSDVVPIYFLSNLDAIALEGIIKQINPKESLFILVSKSGSTLETKENYQRLAKALSSTLSPEAFEKQSILITTPNSPLDQHYKKAKRFYFQKEVGGRFSLLSPVGFVSLALSFGETVVDDLITGARSIDQMCIQKQPLSKNIPLLAACISTWQTSFLGYNSHVVAPYSTLLFDFSLYIHRPTATDPSFAPDGCDSFYVLCPVPNLRAKNVDWSVEGKNLRDRIVASPSDTLLPDLESTIVEDFWMTPKEFKKDYRSAHGAGFSIAPVLSQSASFRYPNRDAHVENLFFVGAGTHPGAGLPGVVSSAKVVDSMIPSVAKKIHV